jgi:hypothetical protein
VGLELTLAAVEVGCPGHQAPLEALLDCRNGLRELDARPFCLPLDDVATLFRQASLLLAQLMARVGPLAGEQALELQHALARLGLDERRQFVARLIADVLQLVRAPQGADETKEPQLGHCRRRESTRGQEECIGLSERLDEVDDERAGGRQAAEPEADRDPEELALTRASQRDADERQSDQCEADRECELESECHRRIL